MTRPVLLLELGAGALPSVTPPAVVAASWVPAVYVPPQVAAPGAFAATPVLDAVLLTWAAVVAPSPQYAIERAPDVAGAPGAWVTIARTADLTYTAAVANAAAYWWRVKALVFGRSSAYTAQVKATAVTVAGSGINLLPDEYSVYEATALPPMSTSAAQTVARGASANDLWAGYAALAIQRTTVGDPYTWLAPAGSPNIAITGGKKYIVSGYVSSDVASQTARFLLGYATGNRQANVSTPAAINSYGRVSALFDLTDLPTTEKIMLGVGNSGAVNSWIRFNGLMIEETVGTLNQPSTYARGTTGAAVVNNAAKLAEIASDNLITPGEKPAVIKERDVLVNEQAGINAKATALVITTEKTAYDNAVSALTTYLAALTAPTLWSDLTGNTDIIGATFRQKFLDVYAARQTLLNKIAVQTLDQLPDGATYGRPLNTRLNGGKPWIDFSEGIHSGKNLDNMGDGVSFRRPGAGYVDASGRVNNMWDDETGVPRTGGFVGGGASRARTGLGVDGKVASGLNDLDRIAEGVTYTRPRKGQFTGGVINGLAQGSNLVANGAFNDNSAGRVHGEVVANGAVVFDNWVANNATATYFDIITELFSTLKRVVLRIKQGVTIPNDLVWKVVGVDTPRFSVFEGKSYYLNAQGQLDQSQGFAAGITVLQRASIVWFSGNASIISEQYVETSNTLGANTYANTFVAPAGAVSAAVVLRMWMRNTGAAAVTTTGLMADVRWNRSSLKEVSSLDTEIENGPLYGRTSNTDLVTGGRVGLRVAGSGHRFGDQRNMPQIAVANLRAKVPTVVSYSAAAGTPATATISIAAFSALAGSVTVSYNAMSVGVTGTNGTTVLYYLYFDDPAYAGGTQTLVATTSASVPYQNDGRVYAGSVSVVYPASGTSSGGGEPGGGTCVVVDMLLHPGVMAAEARAGMVLDCLDLPTGDEFFTRAIHSVDFADSECVRIVTDAGAKLDCSITTPFDVLDGRTVLAPDMLGETVVTDWGLETVASVTRIGVRPVAHIHLGGVSYAAGVDATHRIYSHNLKP